MSNQLLAERLNQEINRLGGLAGGRMRYAKGFRIERTFELLVITTWTEVLGCDEARISVDDWKIPYSYEPAEPRIIYDEIVPVRKKKGGIGLDAMVYVDRRLRIGCESKAYCDISMYKRAHSEFESLFALDPEIVPVVFQAENALGGEIESKTVCSLAADRCLLSDNMAGYLKNRSKICAGKGPSPSVLTLTENKRQSTKDISSRSAPVTAERVGECIEFISRILRAYV